MKRWLIGALTAGCLLFSGQASHASEIEVPKDTYYWVQSTERVNYYFDMKDMHYGVDEKGFIKLNELCVKTLRTYDEVQVQDVVTKRRWNELSLDGYEDLAGVVNDLTFNLAEGIVYVNSRADVNSMMEKLEENTPSEPIKLESLSEKNVEGKFFRAILEYAEKHNEEIIKNTKGELSKEDIKKLEKAKKDAEAAAKKAEKERKKAEKKAEKEKKKIEKDKKENTK